MTSTQSSVLSPQSYPLPRTIALLQQGIAEHLHIGAQLYVSLNGQPIADLALGESRLGLPMKTDTLMRWLSAGKPITAVAIAQLQERGLLDFDDLVARYIPEFAQHGKESITLHHLLLHTGGFRAAASHTTLESWEQTLTRICNSRIEPHWIPGEKAGYHPSSSWFILGEIIRRITGQSFNDYTREKIFLPLGMDDCAFAFTAEQYQFLANRMGILYNTHAGHPVPQEWDTAPYIALARPGSSARGPIRQLGRFYEMLLLCNRPDILSSQSITNLTSRHRVGMFDHTFKQTIDWGLGFLINSRHYGGEIIPYGYGPHASANTFGHGGSQSSTAFADPDHHLVVSLLFNGMPGEIAHNHRLHTTLAALYEDIDPGT